MLHKNKFKIAIDTLPLSTGHAARGTGVYTKNLISALEKSLKNSDKVVLDKFVFKDNLNKLSEYDLVHYPYFDLFYHSLPNNNKMKTVVTVHDVTPLLYPQYYPPGIKGKVNFYLQKKALKNIDAVITISETSKKDIVRFLDIPKEKIYPIHEAPNFVFKKQNAKFVQSIKLKFNLPNNFILYIGDVNWNKNLINLVEAVKKINAKLVIVGKQAVSTDYDKYHIENKPLKELQEKYGGNTSILRLGYVEDRDLNAIWQLATVYCLPSLYEGFGLSVVEAMDAGVPVVCSRTQALVEVAGDAALYFDPKSIDDMAHQIKNLLEDKKLQDSLVSEGSRQVKQFSWEKTATETLKVYKNVLGL